MGTLWVEQTCSSRSNDNDSSSNAGKAAAGRARGADCSDQSRDEGSSKRLNAAQSVPVDVKRLPDERRNGDAVFDGGRSGEDGDDRHPSSNKEGRHDRSSGEPLSGEQHRRGQDGTITAVVGEHADAGAASAQTEKKKPSTAGARKKGTMMREMDYCTLLNRVLPPEIRALAWAPVTEEFSARFSCSDRTYR